MQTTSPRTNRRRIVVMIDGGLPITDHADTRRVIEAVNGAAVLLVAPARAVAGETWVADRDVREAQATARLSAWTAALEEHAFSVDGEIGDPKARLALSDALRYAPADEVIMTSDVADPAPRRGAFARLLDRRGAIAPLRPAALAGHA